MRTTVTYLDALRAKLNLNNDAAVGRALGISRGAVNHYRLGVSSMNDEVAARAAAILGIHPGTIFLDMYAERTRNPEIKHVWNQVAAVFLCMAPTLQAQQLQH